MSRRSDGQADGERLQQLEQTKKEAKECKKTEGEDQNEKGWKKEHFIQIGMIESESLVGLILMPPFLWVSASVSFLSVPVPLFVYGCSLTVCPTHLSVFAST